MEPGPGTYTLILHGHATGKVRTGRRYQEIELRPGYYFYVGSAFGPGGVRAWILRHARGTPARHWHIDYLRAHLRPVGAWYKHGPDRLEHRWAQAFCEMDGMSPIAGFGCSDCGCYSHLFHTPRIPDIALFSRVTGGSIDCWSCPHAGTRLPSYSAFAMPERFVITRRPRCP